MTGVIDLKQDLRDLGLEHTEPDAEALANEVGERMRALHQQYHEGVQELGRELWLNCGDPDHHDEGPAVYVGILRQFIMRSPHGELLGDWACRITE